MAIFSCHLQVVKRSEGRSSVACAAYRAGEALHDQRTDEVHRYANRGGVEDKGIVLPFPSQDSELLQRERLWNAAEAAERRKDGRVAREVMVAIPYELNQEQRRELVQGYGEKLSQRYQVAVDYAIHEPSKKGDERNYHAHMMMTTRRVSAEGLGAKTRELDDKVQGKAEVLHIRQLWEREANRSLEKAQVKERIDSRSLKEQGVERNPTKHQGPAATAIDRRGEFSERAQLNKEIRELTQERAGVVEELEGLQRTHRELQSEIVELYGEQQKLEEVLRTAPEQGDVQEGYERISEWYTQEFERMHELVARLEENKPRKRLWHTQQGHEQRVEKWDERKALVSEGVKKLEQEYVRELSGVSVDVDGASLSEEASRRQEEVLQSLEEKEREREVQSEALSQGKQQLGEIDTKLRERKKEFVQNTFSFRSRGESRDEKAVRFQQSRDELMVEVESLRVWREESAQQRKKWGKRLEELEPQAQHMGVVVKAVKEMHAARDRIYRRIEDEYERERECLEDSKEVSRRRLDYLAGQEPQKRLLQSRKSYEAELDVWMDKRMAVFEELSGYNQRLKDVSISYEGALDGMFGVIEWKYKIGKEELEGYLDVDVEGKAKAFVQERDEVQALVQEDKDTREGKLEQYHHAVLNVIDFEELLQEECGVGNGPCAELLG